jgi:hypothetical protein
MFLLWYVVLIFQFKLFLFMCKEFQRIAINKNQYCISSLDNISNNLKVWKKFSVMYTKSISKIHFRISGEGHWILLKSYKISHYTMSVSENGIVPSIVSCVVLVEYTTQSTSPLYDFPFMGRIFVCKGKPQTNKREQCKLLDYWHCALGKVLGGVGGVKVFLNEINWRWNKF